MTYRALWNAERRLLESVLRVPWNMSISFPAGVHRAGWTIVLACLGADPLCLLPGCHCWDGELAAINLLGCLRPGALHCE